MTRSDHPTGTDRVAEVASADSAEYIVNIQGDEPLIDPSTIDALILSLLGDPELPMGTLKKRIELPDEIENPNVVKVITDLYGNAIYFSRLPIPGVRETPDRRSAVWFKHIGLYIYQREFLLGYSSLDPGPLEQLERLEQLRAIENGYKIRVVETEYDSLGVDTPDDLAKVSQLFQMTEARELHGRKQ
jgi:3-deoxy-manno-octulosonate cytidylyltransferase (CMP-KDO synthetase)